MADNRTLAEMRKDHFYELEQLLKGHEVTMLPTRGQAREFFAAVIREALRKLGVPYETIMSIDEIDCVMDLGNVRLEARRPEGDPKETFWRSGVYIFKAKEDGDHDELAYFVSDIKTRTVMKYGKMQSVECGILTNVDLPGFTIDKKRFEINLGDPSHEAIVPGYNKLMI